MLKEDAKATALNVFQDSQNRSASILRSGSLGGGQTSGEMRLGGRMSCAESASLFRFRAAHRTTNRQDLSRRKLLGLHTYIIQPRRLERWSILLSGVCNRPRIGIFAWTG